MNPIKWAVLPFRNYLETDGRATRSEFWWYFALLITLYMVGFVISELLGLPSITLGYGPIGLLIAIVTLIPTLTVAVRRLHDTNMSGNWVLVFWLLNAAINVFYLTAGGLQNDPAVFAEPEFRWVDLLGLLLLIGMLILFVRPGTRGENRYGQDPRAPA